MKKIIIISLVFFAVSCGSSERTPEAIKNQIQTYKDEIANLEDKIATLIFGEIEAV